ncbi:phytanoyl-CoA dioxygenase [Schizophyllum fasciatum]
MARALEYLTQDQVDSFYRDGYLVLPNFVDEHTTSALLARSKQLLDDLDVDTHPMTRFTTGDDNHVGDDYFLSSGDKIRYFFEEDAVADGRLKHLAVNKIGHGLHLRDPLFRRVTLENDVLRAVSRDLGFHRDPVALQSMVITKQPHIGGEVSEHIDSCYTSPPTALGVWIALEQCTSENGALSFLPGSHRALARTGGVARRFVRLPTGGTGFERIAGPPRWAVGAVGAPRWTVGVDGHAKVHGAYVEVPCEAGTALLIHGAVLHRSPRNAGARTRFAYTFHMVENPGRAVYDARNWLKPGVGGFARVFG